jgi:enterochelin esterase family protein
MPTKVPSPAAAPPDWLAPRPGIAAGAVAHHQLRSAALGNQRSIWVYTPPGPISSSKLANLMILLDGGSYVHHIPAPMIVDNLLAAGRLAPLVLLLVDSLDTATRERELPCYPPFAEFLAGELLPWARARYQFTADPARTIVGGSSYGGLAAAFAAFARPDCFGNVLAQSGSFWWCPAGDTEHEWLARQFVERERLPIEFYLDVGRGEAQARARPNQLIANRHMRDVLRAKGYRVHYAEHAGKHDYAAWRAGFPGALLALADSIEQPQARSERET